VDFPSRPVKSGKKSREEREGDYGGMEDGKEGVES